MEGHVGQLAQVLFLKCIHHWEGLPFEPSLAMSADQTEAGRSIY